MESWVRQHTIITQQDAEKPRSRRRARQICGWKKAASAASRRWKLPCGTLCRCWQLLCWWALRSACCGANPSWWSQKAQADLVSEQSQYTYYNSTLNNQTNITSVEETASRLGLMKVDPSQITYIRLDEGNVLVRKESAVRQWTDLIYSGAVKILGTIN